MLSRFLVFRSSYTRTTSLLYLVLSVPAFVLEFWLEKIGRPIYVSKGQLQKSGEDLEAKGLTEYMFDVLYWSWATTFAASLFGDKAWWMWMAIPAYSGWLAYSTFGGMRQGMAGLAGHSEAGNSANSDGASNRQKKLEKRGGQKVQYR